tara:strand:+ start:366 stop:1103 length:738 start_codon:yes stop_codon:yes gene_type:complete
MPAKSLSSASIWKTLSNINVNEFTEEKGGLTYLSWSHAWRIMMENYPEMQIKWNGTTDEKGVIRDVTYYEGGTAMVSCTVTIGEVQRECWLPVMDYRNKAIAHPSSRDISDAKQRCLVKCFSLYGLANYIYSGDALPEEEEVVAEKPAPKKKAKKKAKKVEAVEEVEAKPNGVDADALASTLKVKCRELHESGWEPDKNLQKKIKTAVADLDGATMMSLLELLDASSETLTKLNDDTEQTEVFDE